MSPEKTATVKKSRQELSRRQFVSGVASGIASAGLAACLPKSVSAVAVSPAAAAAPPPQNFSRGPRERIRFKAVPFPLEQVRLLDGPFLDAARVNQEWLESLPVERLFHSFRVNAKATSTAEPL